jgi:hypothetical protein
MIFSFRVQCLFNIHVVSTSLVLVRALSHSLLMPICKFFRSSEERGASSSRSSSSSQSQSLSQSQSQQAQVGLKLKEIPDDFRKIILKACSCMVYTLRVCENTDPTFDPRLGGVNCLVDYLIDFIPLNRKDVSNELNTDYWNLTVTSHD